MAKKPRRTVSLRPLSSIARKGRRARVVWGCFGPFLRLLCFFLTPFLTGVGEVAKGSSLVKTWPSPAAIAQNVTVGQEAPHIALETVVPKVRV